MRKNVLLIVSISFALSANAQTKLTYQNHSFVVGDKHDFYLAKDASEGKSGANVTWDFSGLVPSGTMTSYMLNPSATLKGSAMTESNVALIENENTFYFKVSKTGMEQFGSFSCNKLSAYTEPFVKLKYPFSFGDVVSGSYSVKTETANAPVDNTGCYKIEADAWGTLILPNGVYNNTLRVKQTRVFQSACNGPEEITYRWYTSSVRYPLLVIIQYVNQGKISVGRVAYYAHSSNDKPAIGIDPNRLMSVAQDLEVYPNPITDQLTVNFHVSSTARVSIDIYSSSGALVKNLMPFITKEAGSYSENYNISSKFPPAFYYVKAIIGDQTFVKKIIKL